MVRKVKVNIHPPQYYDKGKYPVLHRITKPPTTTFEGWDYMISAKAADILEKCPAALFHNRVYNSGEKGTYYYTKKGEDICVINSITGGYSEEVAVFAPGEYQGKDEHNVELADSYPAMFLPFELDQLCHAAELSLSRGVNGYCSNEFSSAIYLRSSPFVAYWIFHYLINYAETLNGKEINKVIEIGSGLAAVSFLASQLFKKAREICGIELDGKLVIASSKIKRQLGKRFNFSNVRLCKRDIFQMKQEISESDMLIGWFPLGYNIADGRMRAMYRDLKQGGLLVEIFKTGPLSGIYSVEEEGFKRVQFQDPLPAGIFIRQ